MFPERRSRGEAFLGKVTSCCSDPPSQLRTGLRRERPCSPAVELCRSSIRQPSRAIASIACRCCRDWHMRTILVAALRLLGAMVGDAAEKLSHTNLLQFIAPDGAIESVRSTNDWSSRRQSILRAMQEVMGPLPGKEKRCPLDVKVEEEVDCGEYVRRFISYASEPGARVPAYLLVPKAAFNSTKRFPAVLALHQTHALGQKVVVSLSNRTNDEYGVELVRRGYVVLAPPYPILANYDPDLKKLGYESGTMKAIWDNMRGLDLLEALPFVKRGSFGAIGHSLGGHNSIFTAASDNRITVIVSSCGFDSFVDYYAGAAAVWTPARGWCRTRHM